MEWTQVSRFAIINVCQRRAANFPGPTFETVNCPWCGAKNPVRNETCADCGKVLTVYIGPRPKVKTLRLADVMGWIALIALCLAASRLIPCLGIAIGLLLFPPFLRTSLTVAERRLDDRPMSFHQIYVEAWISLGITFLIGVVGLIPFLLISPFEFAILHFSPIGGIVCLMVCGVASVFLMAKTTRNLWPRRD